MSCKSREFLGSLPGIIGIIPRENKKSSVDIVFEPQPVVGCETKQKFTREKWDECSQKKIESAAIQRRVEELFCEASRHLRMRQEKLRECLRSEENMYLAELCQQGDPLLAEREKLKEKFCCMSAKREAERVAYVLKKYEQQFRENCEELRNLVDPAVKRNLSEEYKELIQQKRDLENLKLEEEKIFMELWNKDYETKSRQEIDNIIKRRESNMQNQEALKNQILETEARRERERLEKEDDLRKLEEEKRQLQVEEDQRLEAKRNLKQAKQDEYKQLLENKRNEYLKELQNIQSFDNTLIKEAERTNAEIIEKKKNLKMEQDRFKEYQNFIQNERLRQKKIDDAEFLKDADAVWEKRREDWLKEKKMKDATIKDLNEQRRKLIDEKFQKRLNNQEDDEVARKEIEMELELEERERQALKKKKENYKDALFAQMQYKQEQLNKRFQEDIKMAALLEKADCEHLAKVNDFKSKPMPGHLHPLRRPGCFGKISNSCPPRRSGAIN